MIIQKPTIQGYLINETVTITATTTAPTKGATTMDKMVLADHGNGFCSVLMNYYQSTAGSAGSGDYLFHLPSGYSFDTSVHAANQIVGDPGMSGVEGWIMGSNGKLVIQPSLMAVAYAVVWDATKFRLLMGQEILFGSNTSVRTPAGNNFFSMSSAGIGYSVGFTFKKL